MVMGFIILLPRSQPSPAVVKPLSGRYDTLSDPVTFMKPLMLPSVILERNATFSRIQSAHSRAMAFWVSSFRSLTSNSVPYSERSRPSRGM